MTAAARRVTKPSLHSIDETARCRRVAFGAVVRTHRTQLGITQRELATRAGCDRQSINRIEGAGYSPSLDRIWRVADALGVPLSTLVDEAEARLQHDPAGAR